MSVVTQIYYKYRVTLEFYLRSGGTKSEFWAEADY